MKRLVLLICLCCVSVTFAPTYKTNIGPFQADSAGSDYKVNIGADQTDAAAPPAGGGQVIIIGGDL